MERGMALDHHYRLAEPRGKPMDAISSILPALSAYQNLMWSSEVQHPPRIGALYGTEPKRLMLLGESHYASDPEMRGLTIEVVDEWASGVSCAPYRFFTKLAIMLSGEEPWQLSRTTTFAPIAFYNYVTKCMPRARHRPTPEEFAASEPAFREVIEAIRPTHIVAIGYRLWENMPCFDPSNAEGFHAILDGDDFELGRFRTANASPLAMRVKHPSCFGSFDGREWHPKVKAFLALD
jgi:hypothetical protein